jgi:Serine aminopeptidase, S33
MSVSTSTFTNARCRPPDCMYTSPSPTLLPRLCCCGKPPLGCHCSESTGDACPGHLDAAAAPAGARSSSPSSACLSPPRFAHLCITTMASAGTPCIASNVRSLTIMLRRWVAMNCVATLQTPWCLIDVSTRALHTSGSATALAGVYVCAALAASVLTPRHVPPPARRSHERALVCSRHGCSSSATLHLAVFKRWAAAGVASASYDVHGHGRSEPKEDSGQVTLRDFQHVVDDARQHLFEVAEPLRAATCPHAPLFLCGASMGGSTVRRCRWCALRRAALTSQVLVCGPQALSALAAGPTGSAISGFLVLPVVVVPMRIQREHAHCSQR